MKPLWHDPFRAADSALLNQALNMRCQRTNTPGVNLERIAVVNYPNEITTTNGFLYTHYIGPLLLNLSRPRLFLFDRKLAIDDNIRLSIN